MKCYIILVILDELGYRALTNKLTFAVNLVFAHLATYVVPRNLTGLWNTGFITGVLFVLQMVTGFLLTFNYVPYHGLAFESLVKVLFDVNFGWAIRYLHAQGVSFIFMFLYIHVFKAMVYSVRYKMLSWLTGFLVYILTMIVAFFGYTLPNGQMSYWGSTVIINLFYYLESFTRLILGGYSVHTPTLQRFYILHFVTPFIALFFIILHVYFLHKFSSSNPILYSPPVILMRFYPTLILSDFKMLTMVFALLTAQLGYGVIPLFQGDHENSVMADPLSTPLHIYPEWYLLFFYSMLKLCPNKIAGIMLMIYVVVVTYQLCTGYHFAQFTHHYVPSRTWFEGFTLVVPSIICIGYLGYYDFNEVTLVASGVILKVFYSGISKFVGSKARSAIPKKEKKKKRV